MKQIVLTDSIQSKLKAAAGDGVDLNNLAVFKATALNTLPVRKAHPVYKDGVHSRTFLEQMLSQLNSETLPLQIMHDGGVLPIGRIFDGEVVELADRTELQVLFWIDKTSSQGSDNVGLVNNGTVDQVSVAILPKSAISNKSGFDFLGPDATFENIWTGTDPDGNVMGQDGAHVLMSALDTWFEMSIVGRGGIKGAKIHPSGDMKLAASGLDAPRMTLILSTDNKEDNPMDLMPLVNELSTAKAELLTANAAKATADAALQTAQARIAELEGQLAAATPAAEKLAASEASGTALATHLKGLFSHTASITGDVTATAPEDPEALVIAVKANIAKLRPGSARVMEASAGSGSLSHSPANSAFKRRA